MSKKLIAIGTALALAFAVAIVAAGDNNAVACDGKAKATTASAKSNCSSTSAAKVASASCCARSTAAVASASSCNKSASAKTASASCNKSATVVVAGSGCKKATASTAGNKCSASSKVASSGCCDAKNAVAGYSKKEETPQEHADALKKIVDEIPAGNNKRVVLSGSMECGNCSHHATATCAPLLKTTDGKIYPLLDNNLVKDMRHDKSAKNGFEVSTRVKKIYGVKYLDVVAYKSL